MQLTASMFYFIPTPLLLFILGTTYKFYLALVYSRITTLFNHKTNDTRVKSPPNLNDRGLKWKNIFLQNKKRDENDTSVGIKRRIVKWWERFKCLSSLVVYCNLANIYIPYNNSVSKYK